MPIATTSNSSISLSGKPVSQTRQTPKPTKKRVVKRRGRGRNAFDSDEEIEREAQSDSDLEPIDANSSDSDTEPELEGKSQIPKPTVHTPKDDLSSKVSAMTNGDHTPFFVNSTDWSEIVADEAANGASTLPVIDFADMNRDLVPTHPRNRKPKKPTRKFPASEATSLPSPPLSNKGDQDEEPEEEPSATALPSTSAPLTEQSSAAPSDRRHPGQSSRQAYQDRLNKDPSYVPTVGEFWGHDERLLDKDLRSLSGWWRGRWHGRGRGFDRGFSMRGRGAAPVTAPVSNESPVEKKWTHDGYEEMRRNEQRRREAQQQQEQQQNFRGGARGGFRGRPGFFRARGGFFGGRGGFTHGSHSPAPSNRSSNDPGRVWFAMKPQLMWTKQHDGFLHYDSSSRRGGAPFIRVKLPGPGSRVHVVKTPLAAHAASARHHRSETPVKLSITSTGSPSSTHGSEYAGKVYTVKLPPKKTQSKQVPQQASNTASELASVILNKPSDDDAFVVRPRLVPPAQPLPLPESANVAVGPIASAPGPSHMPDQHAQQQLEKLSFELTAPGIVEPMLTEEAVLGNPGPSNANADASKAPPTGPPAAYAIPFGYPPPMPPQGVAYNHLGLPYDVATGQPVYFQAPPAMPPLFNVVNSHSRAEPSISHHFVHGHVRHHSTVEYMQPPPGPQAPPPGPPPMLNHGGFFDPETGAHVHFSLPRQSAAIKIRAPDGSAADGQDKSAQSPSGSTSADASTAFVPPSHLSEGMYNPYAQQPYYYPPYGYNPYSVPYASSGEMYPPQPPEETSPVYY